LITSTLPTAVLMPKHALSTEHLPKWMTTRLAISTKASAGSVSLELPDGQSQSTTNPLDW
jgi:hypothetical protein